MFIRKSKHDAIVKGLRDQIETINALGCSRERRLTSERDAARAELAPLKAAKESRLARLAASNDRRRKQAAR